MQPVRLGDAVVDNRVIFSVLAFMLVYGATVIGLSMVLLLTDLDPGDGVFCRAGQRELCRARAWARWGRPNFAVLTDFQVWVCTLAMLLGRLEILSFMACSPLSGAADGEPVFAPSRGTGILNRQSPHISIPVPTILQRVPEGFMVPHLITALTGPINELEQRILVHARSIERWFRLEWMEHTPRSTPRWTSAMRASSWRPVDTNLFPGGWNNLTKEMLPWRCRRPWRPSKRSAPKRATC